MLSILGRGATLCDVPRGKAPSMSADWRAMLCDSTSCCATPISSRSNSPTESVTKVVHSTDSHSRSREPEMITTVRVAMLLVLVTLSLSSPALAQHRQAPPGMFKDLDDEIVGKAIVLHGKQLFIDNYVIEGLTGAKKVLNQPVKHPKNPLVRRDKPWEATLSSPFGYGAVVRDERDGRYKIWYQIWHDDKDAVGSLGYVTSPDGITWEKPITDKQSGNNFAIFDPQEPWVSGAGVIIDQAEKNPERRFKMMYLAKPTGKSSSLQSCVAYSADGVHWKPEPKNPLIPYSDTQIALYWDARLNRFVAYLRFGPPNVRIISRIKSEDFLHWSPKVTVVKKSKLDAPFSTELYTMGAMPYEGVHIGVLNTYKVIEDFGTADCTPITTDSVRHVVSWKGDPDCHLLQARPIKLRFHLKNAKLYSFEPKIRNNHYLQSYD